ncbi:MAG: NAD(P)/FAD-dependent oxidoreductase, partial [Aeromonadaceae bacterium]|nr:NAD(P)/FAD-dependent oxidoreductase [Aeromonadaceae bacterium]
SGPAILQISSYWQPGEPIRIHLLPGRDVLPLLQQWQRELPAQELKTVLGRELPKRLVEKLIERGELVSKPLRQYTARELEGIASLLEGWSILPNGTEGYRTAEVTLGGVDTDELSSKTMESKQVPGLYVIGEVMDVTGWLGGFNFQWCWSSGWVAGQFV